MSFISQEDKCSPDVKEFNVAVSWLLTVRKQRTMLNLCELLRVPYSVSYYYILKNKRVEPFSFSGSGRLTCQFAEALVREYRKKLLSLQYGSTSLTTSFFHNWLNKHEDVIEAFFSKDLSNNVELRGYDDCIKFEVFGPVANLSELEELVNSLNSENMPVRISRAMPATM